MFHARVSQVRVSLFCAAILVTNVDIKSLIVGYEAPMPTHTSPPPTYITTTKPFSTPLIWYTDRFKVPTYDHTTSFSESSAVKTVYVLDRPNARIPRSKAPAKPPRKPLQTGSTLFRYLQYLKGVTTAESFKFVELRLASHTTAKDREVNKLRTLLEEWEKASNRAMNAAEIVVAAKQTAYQKAVDEIARLHSMIEDGGNALTKEQEDFKQKLSKAAEETARLHKEQDSTLGREKDF
ncbi:MAG: hypothetical protein ALECFALPRED_005075 [Alectoria fallacina]|uniref:Uncharacterized protein n=1 Tax=Alectoria fallacina TaxID=1903189 RepID=A0A8H3FV80_9LECA|nr:MAG: hypothetical protein ALECFALPRED_005075 [Alectoria fallacina]